MKKNIFRSLATLLLFFPLITSSQVSGISSANGGTYEMVFVPGEKEDKSAAFKKIAPKMYETLAYLPATVEGINETFFLRHNIYRDEMEFSKNGGILYLKKNKERKITFNQSNHQYRLFKLNDKLKYFMVHNSGENILLSRKVIEYQDAKPAKSSYDKDKAADFKRKNDEVFIKFKNNSIVEAPRNKKKFYAMFGDNSSKIKKFIKKNKLNIKKISDLTKIVAYLNTL